MLINTIRNSKMNNKLVLILTLTLFTSTSLVFKYPLSQNGYVYLIQNIHYCYLNKVFYKKNYAYALTYVNISNYLRIQEKFNIQVHNGYLRLVFLFEYPLLRELCFCTVVAHKYHIYITDNSCKTMLK